MAFQLNPLTSLSAKGDVLFVDTNPNNVVHFPDKKRYEMIICSPDMPNFKKAYKGRSKIVVRYDGQERLVTCPIVHAGGSCTLLMEYE
jgi:hypothetical protein